MQSDSQSRSRFRFGIYDVFADRPFDGNQAAVVHGIPLAKRQFLAIAAEFLLPETVVREGTGTTLRLRYATADRIMARCGHATLAAVADYCLSLPTQGMIMRGSYMVDRKKAEWHGLVAAKNRVEVAVAWPELPVFRRKLCMTRVADAVSLKPRDINPSLPLCVYDSGNINALLPVLTAEALRKSKPDGHKLRRLFERERLTDLHLYWIENYNAAKKEIKVRCRNVFPYGVGEESATGSASAALAGALIEHFRGSKELKAFEFVQHANRRRGVIKVEVRTGANCQSDLWLIGSVFCIATGQLWQIPEKVMRNHDK